MSAIKTFFRHVIGNKHSTSIAASNPPSPTIPPKEPRAIPSEVLELIITSFLWSSPSIKDRRNFMAAAITMSVDFAIITHNLTSAELHVLSPEHARCLIRYGPSQRKFHRPTTPIYPARRTLAFTIEEGDERMVVAMQDMMNALAKNPKILPSARSLVIHYHNTSYSWVLRDGHIPKLPSHIKSLTLRFTHSSPSITERMKQEYQHFTFTTDVGRANHYLPDVGCLSIKNAPDRFVKHFLARCPSVLGLDVDKDTDLRVLKGFMENVQSITRK